MSWWPRASPEAAWDSTGDSILDLDVDSLLAPNGVQQYQPGGLGPCEVTGRTSQAEGMGCAHTQPGVGAARAQLGRAAEGPALAR